jgi:hypothetical protein
MNTDQFNTEKGKEWIRGLLFETEVFVTFTKKDGEKREMRCTLNEELMKKNATADQYEVKGAGRKSSNEAQAVFDLDKLSWRSFRFDSVESVKFAIK